MYKELSTPAVIVDLDTVENNIRNMAEKLSAAGIDHRPHIKTHKSVKFARMQLAAGARGITTAKLSEAEVFAEAGFDDILVAHSIVGEDNRERLAALHRKIDVRVTVDSLESAVGLSAVGEKTGKPVKVLIEIDGGLHRGGRQPGQDAVDFARELQRLPGIEIEGIMGYFGLVYKENTVPEIAEYAKYEAQTVNRVASDLRKAGIPVSVVSSGSTPTSLLGEHLRGAVTEVRAGNYIFYDVSAVEIGFAEERDCALRVIATVISTPLPGMATIDAGTKTLTSDKSHHGNGFGRLVGLPGAEIASLNEEHGFVRFDPERVSLRVGDRVEIIPNHSCVIPNLNGRVFGVRRGKLEETIPVDARGCDF
ncbi:alanine racemase [Cohnella caldifontis]|uniref:alanine racemase n=1 Tax=Cohnella caldifontis TaxID=3027471 RepID=UPI0023ED586D|nr:alanine racemase [Cohnella sp. YIM B05605]